MRVRHLQLVLCGSQTEPESVPLKSPLSDSRLARVAGRQMADRVEVLSSTTPKQREGCKVTSFWLNELDAEKRGWGISAIYIPT